MKRRTWLPLLGLAVASQSCVIMSTNEPAVRVEERPVLEARLRADDRPPPRQTPRPVERELGGY
jgi:hypothetical protein